MATSLKLIAGANNDIIDVPLIPAAHQKLIDKAQHELASGKHGSLRVGPRGTRLVIHHDPQHTTIAKYDPKLGVREVRHYDITGLDPENVIDYVESQIQKGEQLQDVCEVVKRYPASLPSKKKMLAGKS